MRLLRIISLILVLSVSCGVYAQGLRPNNQVVNDEEVTKPDKTKEKKTQQTTKQTIQHQEETNQSDTVYAHGMAKQNGWMMPYDIIDKKNKDKYYCVYRFTNKLANGQYTKFDVIDGYGNYAPGRSTLSPYILKHYNTADSTANTYWRQLLQTVCRYETLPDPTMSYVVQERAYDKDMNLVYTFSNTPIGDNKFIGSYRDYGGFPAEMRIDPQYTYGTLVEITRDRFGNDSIVQFIDAKGVKKLNPDGAAKEQYISDEKGRMLSCLSMDTDGRYIIDLIGNTGQKVYYDDSKNPYQPYKLENVGTDGKPMMITQKTAEQKYGVSIATMEYDDLGRMTAERFYDSTGSPCHNFYGAHKVVYEYDDHGNTTKIAGYNLSDKSAPFVYDVVATMISETDDCGHTTKIQYFDRDGKPAYMPDRESRVEFVYDSIGNQIDTKYWQPENGTEVLKAHKSVSDTCHYMQMANGYTTIDHFDSKGRAIKNELLRDGKPEMGMYGYSYAVTDFYDGDNSNSNVTYYYDTEGNLTDNIQGFCKSEATFLNDSTTITVKTNVSGRVTERYKQILDSALIMKYQYDVNRFGNVCRSGGSGGVFCYKTDGLKNRDGMIMSYIGKDEYDEPDYILTINGVFYFSNADIYNNGKFYDEYGDPIDDMATFLNVKEKAVTVEVIDQRGYDLGFRDNDLILKYGDYTNPLTIGIDMSSYYGNWALQCVLKSNSANDIIVFRIEPETLEPKLVKISGIKGTLSDNGILTHRRILTSAQKSRISQEVYLESIKDDAMLTFDEFYKTPQVGENQVVLAYPYMPLLTRGHAYPKEITDPSILLAVNSPRKGEKWLSGDDFANLNNLLVNVGKNFNNYYYLSTDGKEIRTLEASQDPASSWLIINVDDKTYETVNKLVKKADKEITDKKQKKRKINPEELYGTWRAVVTQESHGMEGEIVINFTDGEAEFIQQNVAYQPMDLTTKLKAVMECKFKLDWWIKDNIIKFGSDKRDMEIRLKESYLVGPNWNMYYNQHANFKEMMNDPERLKHVPQYVAFLNSTINDLLIEELEPDFFRATNNQFTYDFDRVNE